VLDQLAIAPRLGRLVGVRTRAGLDRGLLIRAEHEIAWLEQLALPATFVQIKNTTGLLGKQRVAWKDANALTSTTCAGGKRRGRPGRGLSLSPPNPSWQNRFRHVETAWRG
jgi:hypothetical protein